MKTFYPIKEFGAIYKMGNEVEFSGGDNFVRITAGEGKHKGGLLVSNMGCVRNCEFTYKIAGAVEKICFYVTDKDNDEKLIMKLGYRKSKDKIYLLSPKNRLFTQNLFYLRNKILKKQIYIKVYKGKGAELCLKTQDGCLVNAIMMIKAYTSVRSLKFAVM